jgi:hypothetical protein
VKDNGRVEFPVLASVWKLPKRKLSTEEKGVILGAVALQHLLPNKFTTFVVKFIDLQNVVLLSPTL